MKLGKRTIGPGHPAYIIAEMSGNHNQSFEKAVEIVHAMKDAGADAVKLQTYTADTLTIESDRPEFMIGGATLWDGKTLHQLYEEAATPWKWHPKLKKIANDLGMDLFSTPFDPTATDFLDAMGVPAYKISSFELVDIPLIEHIAKKKKPIILSTGMGTREEIADAVNALRNAGNDQLILLKCTSAYPAPLEAANLKTIPDMSKQFGVPVGLSDHTPGSAVPVAAVTLGACVIEKHFCLSRKEKGVDSAFSLEPREFKAMVEAVRNAESDPKSAAVDPVVLGNVSYGPTEYEKASTVFRRSLYVVKDVKKGEAFTEQNVRSIRPGNGMPPKELPKVLGRKAVRDIARGTPLKAELIE